MPETTPLRVAIVGAGIAGLGAAIALQKHDGIDVQLYERAHQLQEIGASIALGPNGMRTLERLGVHEALEDDVAFRNKSGRPMVYRHWKTNEVVSVDHHRGKVEYRHQTARYYRPHLQQALLAHIDPSRIHTGKAFAAVEELHHQGDDTLLVSFADGSTVTADVLLGADGINSAVRRSFVPSSAPKWTGWVAFRSVFDAKLVEHIPGVLEEANHWWGHDRTFFASRLGRDLFTVVGGWHGDPDAHAGSPYQASTWNSDGDVAVLREYYKDWHPVVRQMIDASPYTRLYPNTFASSLESWVHGGGRVTYAGDAAHAHGGAFAAGGSLALDDAYAFALAIFHVYPPGSAHKPGEAGIRTALGLYEQTRKAHTDRVLSTVREGNKKKVESLGRTETDEQLRRRMSDRADPAWIHEHDVEAAFAQAVEREGKTPTAEQARL
ncbi:hypothetical protein LTR36_006807 [Oleoguttula mirabilis]|uniref:FAD-binding domain-containing protein n=1 Tax=Oleoguttula mirabilis TaxID=1507867 RepID=A0AAV9JBA3_9PEZI|nr:hypothetical protein LTR36_006807 [Oleoguttula mirabilis]